MKNTKGGSYLEHKEKQSVVVVEDNVVNMLHVVVQLEWKEEVNIINIINNINNTTKVKNNLFCLLFA